MKRIALAVAVVVMAAGACKKADNSNAGMQSDTTKMMADSMKMAPAADTMKMGADTSKMHADTTHRTTTRPRTRRP